MLAVELPIAREVVVVDDGSTDGTAVVLHELGTRVTKVHVSPVNRGKGAAIRQGLTMASGDIVLIQDADLELNPEEYCRLLQPILSGGAAVVYGSRFLRPGSGTNFPRRAANRLLTGVTNLLYGTRLTDMETAYKVFRSEVAQRVRLRSRGFEFEPEITARIVRAGFRITEVPISYCPRTRDEGKKIRWRDGVKSLYCLFKYRFTD